MKTACVIGGIVTIIVAIAIAVPAIKGPINRYRLEANEKLNAEYVVDNYKAEYVKLHDKRIKVVESISKFDVEKRVALKKLEYATNEVAIAKSALMSTGTSDLKAFNRAKNIYEIAKTKVGNFQTLVTTYELAIAKLNKSLALIDENMSKAKLNVDTLSSKKILVDTIKTVNKSIETMNGVDNSDLAVNIEKLDDDMLRESVKLEALENAEKPTTTLTEADAKAYIENLK